MSTGGLWNMKATRRFSLLSSKSLNNLQTDLAPSEAAQKSARRAQRVLQGPGGVITISAGIPGSSRFVVFYVWLFFLNGVDRADAIPEASEVNDGESAMVSFQDAAAMFIASNSGLSGSSRQRPINPHKSRRLATDFGLGCHTGKPPPEPPLARTTLSAGPFGELTPPMSSAASTPLSISDAYTASDTSSFQGLVGFASEFPQPPSLSPALRRMQSVPWLKNEDALVASLANDLVQPGAHDPTGKSGAVDIPFANHPDDIQTLQSDDASSYGSSALSQRARVRTRGLDFEMVGEALVGLDMNPPRSRPDRDQIQTRAVSRASWARRSNRKTWTTDDLLQWSVSHRAHLGNVDHSESFSEIVAEDHRPQRHIDNRRYTLCARPEEALIERPRIIRKVVSMQGRSKASFSDKSGQRPIQKIKSLRLFPSSSGNNSRHDLAGGGEGKHRNWLFSRSSHRQGASSMDYGKMSTNPHPIRTPYPSVSMQDVGSVRRPSKGKASGSHRDSVWLTGLGLSNYEFSTDSRIKNDRPIQDTFRAHPRLAAAKSHGNLPDTLNTSASFISITPDKRVKGEKSGERRTKVQRLIARASNGFLEWGKNLTNRRHHSP